MLLKSARRCKALLRRQAQNINAARPPIPLAPIPHAAGGIFTRPHVGLVAERGPEAIIPLNKPGGFLGSIHVHSNPVFNVGPGADQGSLTQALSEYARELAYEIKKQFAIEAEQSAVV